jgi:hypothetical protein
LIAAAKNKKGKKSQSSRSRKKAAASCLFAWRLRSSGRPTT